MLGDLKKQAEELTAAKSKASENKDIKGLQLDIEAAQLGVRITEIRISVLNKLDSMGKPAAKQSDSSEE